MKLLLFKYIKKDWLNQRLLNSMLVDFPSVDTDGMQGCQIKIINTAKLTTMLMSSTYFIFCPQVKPIQSASSELSYFILDKYAV